MCSINIHHIFILLSIDGHLGCFYIFATVKIAIINTGVHVSFQTGVTRSEISGFDGTSVIFLSNFYPVFYMAVPVHILTNVI